MTKPDQVLKMSTASALQKLNTWVKQYQIMNGFHTNILYDENMQIGEGKVRYKNDKLANIAIGTYPLSISFPAKYLPMKDLDFVKMGVTTFHELTHCKRSMSENTLKEILISDLSKCYNKEYYCAEHHRLPHEIDAEYNGVMSMWSTMKNEWPGVADKLMIDYLNYRTESSDHVKKLYMIERPECGFQSKQQVKDLFEEAYEKSLTEKRRLPNGFIDYKGDTSRLLATDDGRGLRVEYAPVYLKLSKAETGIDTDQMMASLISYIHPELRKRYTRLDFEGLEPDRVFHLQIPETIEDVWARLGYEDTFAAGVEYVTGLQDDGQEL